LAELRERHGPNWGLGAAPAGGKPRYQFPKDPGEVFKDWPAAEQPAADG
jgi:hypothetical protein